MAREVYRFSVQVPAGTLQASPQVTALTMPERIVRSVEVTVPPGPHGLVGFQFTHQGSQLIPINAGQFLVMEGRTRKWELDQYLTSGQWQLTAYNTGSFNHTLEIVFEVDILQSAPTVPAFQPLPADALAG